VSSAFEFIRDLPFRSCGSMLSVQGFDTAIPADFVSENRSHLIARGGLIQPPTLSGTVLVYSAMSCAHPADLRVRDKQGMGVSGAAENTADTCASKLLKRRSRTGSSPARYSIRTPQSHPPIEKSHSGRLTGNPEVTPKRRHFRVGDQPLGTPLSCLFSARGVTRTCFHQLTAIYMVGGNQKATKPVSVSCFSGAEVLVPNRSSNTFFSTETN
jgi:hypothetical protein